MEDILLRKARLEIPVPVLDLTETPRLSGYQYRFKVAQVIDNFLLELWKNSGISGDGVALLVSGVSAGRRIGALKQPEVVIVHGGKHEIANTLTQSLRAVLPAQHIHVLDIDGIRGYIQDGMIGAFHLLDMRTVVGDHKLGKRAHSLALKTWRSLVRTQLEPILMRSRQRWKESGSLWHLDEPDLYLSHGGLRDVTMTRLLSAALLTDYSHQIDYAEDLLLDVAYSMQAHSGADTYVFSRQLRQSLKVKISPETETSRINEDADVALFKAVAQAGTVVAETVEGVVSGALDICTRPRILPRIKRGVRRRLPIEHEQNGIGLLDGEVILTSDPDYKDTTLALRAANVALQNEVSLSRGTIGALRRCAVPGKVWDSCSRSLFLKLISSGNSLPKLWTALEQANLVSRLIPEWSHIAYLPNRNPIHRYTLEWHSVLTAVATTKLLDGTIPANTLPDTGVSLIPPQLAALTGLIHCLDDSGLEMKAPVQAEAVMKRMGIDQDWREDISSAISVREKFINTAVTENILDSKSIGSISKRIGHNTRRLALVVLLVAAHGIATSKEAYNSMKIQAVSDLAHIVHERNIVFKQ